MRSHNGEAEPKARRIGMVIETLEFLEDQVALILSDAAPAVVDLDDEIARVPPAAQHGVALLLVIFERVRNKVLEDAPQELPGRSG